MIAVNGAMKMAKVTVPDILSKKEKGEKITQLTAYDFPSAQLVDEAGIDMILVGDSLGTVVLGYENTLPVTVDDIVHHTRPVARGAKRALIVGDLPFMAYHVSIEDTIRNSGRIIKSGGADAVKLEGGKEVAGKVKALVEAGIPVQAHVGLMPQRAAVLGGLRIQGVEAEAGVSIIEDAVALEEAGAFSIVLEFVTAEVAQIITETLSIPTIGIGSGPSCDGQVLVLHDLLGVYKKNPPFARKYVDLREIITKALKDYGQDVRDETFPGTEHTFHMDAEEKQRLVGLLKAKK